MITICLLAAFLVSCSNPEPQRPQAPRVPVAELEKTYGRLFSVANEPTPQQNGTGDVLGLFRDQAGTIWGIPLASDESGNLLGCAPPALRDAAPSFTLTDKAIEIVGTANEPNGWRGGTGKLMLLLRDANGRLQWQAIDGIDLSTGPVCLSQSPPVQRLKFYRIARAK